MQYLERYAIGPDTEEIDHRARLAKTPKDWQDPRR